MAAPNLAASTVSITGETAVLAVTTSASDIISSIATDYAAKVRSLKVANIDGTNSCWVTVDLYRSATAYRVVYQMTVPAGVTLSVIGAEGLYLKEGDALRLTAQNNSDLEAVCSYELITD